MAPDEPTHILVVDDLPEKLLVYRSVLGGAGYNLVTASSGEEALRAVLRQDFAVILLDVQMQGMDGFETASLIRKRKRSAHTPIIFLTAFADEVRVAEGYAQGAVDYITTPIVPEILQAKVRVFADLYRMTQQVKRQAQEQVALTEERMRREAAEEANKGLAFLVRVGNILGQSLDPDLATQDVIRLPLPELADLVMLITAGPSGNYPLGYMDKNGPVLGKTSSLATLDPDLRLLVTRVWADDHSLLQPDKAFVLPLRARGRVFAALVLSRRPSGRSYSAPDHALAISFASRCAMALENARLYQEVQSANRQKNEFLSMLAHELRNPLAPILNATVLLGQPDLDPARIKWVHGILDRQLTHLIRLVDDLLDISRITLGKIRLTFGVIDLRAVMEQAVEAVQPLLNQLGHEFDLDLPVQPVYVSGDKARLVQVFINLLNNAAKYTEPGGRIWLSVQQRDGTVVVRVRDTGIGISPELLPAVFDLFTQASRSLDRSQGGLGVGLTLVRQLVEMHGGSVQAFSEGLGRGSEFVVRLSSLPEDSPLDSSDQEQSANPQSLRIVVVDDHADGADTLAQLLRGLGHDVRVAYNGPNGIALTQSFDPDLVLLDIGLPGMDGYEVARRLRSEGAAAGGAIIVAVSGYGQDVDRNRARQAGFSHHFVKPVEFDTLQKLLTSYSPRPPGDQVAATAPTAPCPV
jgi:signal transduction histidine kinase